jgi:hypothetical protein
LATKIKIVFMTDFLEVTADGIINMATSRKLLLEIAKAEHSPVDYDLLIDFRDTEWQMSALDIYQLAAELCRHGETFDRKVAILVHPGVNFDPAAFMETCSHNRGYRLDAFTDFETAIRWLLAREGPSQVLPPLDTTDKDCGD